MKGSFTAELVATIGTDATRRLIEVYGGSPLYIPQCHLDHPITDAVGEHAARLLCARFGGSRVIVPLGQRLALERRNKAIQADREAGLSVAALARKYRLSLRQTYNALGAEPAAITAPVPTPIRQRQLSLF